MDPLPSRTDFRIALLNLNIRYCVGVDAVVVAVVVAAVGEDNEVAVAAAVAGQMKISNHKRFLMTKTRH